MVQRGSKVTGSYQCERRAGAQPGARQTIAASMAIVATAKISSAMASLRRLSSHSFASSPPERSATAGYIGCESLDEAEPLQQLSKLDVVAGHGAEQKNQLEPAHSHRSSSYLV